MLTPSHTTWFVRFKNADRCEKSLNVDKLNSKSDKKFKSTETNLKVKY